MSEKKLLKDKRMLNLCLLDNNHVIAHVHTGCVSLEQTNFTDL